MLEKIKREGHVLSRRDKHPDKKKIEAPKDFHLYYVFGTLENVRQIYWEYQGTQMCLVHLTSSQPVKESLHTYYISTEISKKQRYTLVHISWYIHILKEK